MIENYFLSSKKTQRYRLLGPPESHVAQVRIGQYLYPCPELQE